HQHPQGSSGITHHLLLERPQSRSEPGIHDPLPGASGAGRKAVDGDGDHAPDIRVDLFQSDTRLDTSDAGPKEAPQGHTVAINPERSDHVRWPVDETESMRRDPDNGPWL